MSKRLPELLRQRALLQEHLAWLDREIAAEQSPSSAAGSSHPQIHSPAPPTSAASAAVPTFLPPPLPKESTEDVETIVAQYRQDPLSLQQDTRKGCLMLFIYGSVGCVVLVLLAYWLYARHLGRWW